jgi:hypothetical protein
MIRTSAAAGNYPGLGPDEAWAFVSERIAQRVRGQGMVEPAVLLGEPPIGPRPVGRVLVDHHRAAVRCSGCPRSCCASARRSSA